MISEKVTWRNESVKKRTFSSQINSEKKFKGAQRPDGCSTT